MPTDLPGPLAPATATLLARDLRRDRWLVVVAYLVLALVWILCSDAAVKVVAGDMQTAAQRQTIKGTFFVLNTCWASGRSSR